PGTAQPGSLAAAPPTPTLGSSNTVTADPPVPRPRTTPCTVELFSNFTFADFSPKPFTYAPPSSCPGPWAKVVLEADFSVTAGRQFDRTAQIAIGHANVYYGTTAEPSRTLSPAWHVERDLTDYSPLFTSVQAGDVNLGNLVNSTFTGVLAGSARLLFYPVSDDEPAPRTADLVLSLSDAPGGAALLATTASILAPSLSLPANIESAYLDVITQSQSGDEFWYTCVPNDVAAQLGSCPGTAFREAEVTVDGQPAGFAPVYPWIFTGGIDPFLWRPIPGVQTLNFVPYRVDLTPFAGVLSNGRPHQVGISVFNANNYFLVTGSLLLYLDRGAHQVTGAVTLDTLGATLKPSIKENLTTAADGSITGSVTTGSARRSTVAGYVDTSHGRVETTVRQDVEFSNVQQFVSTATRFVQNITQKTTVAAATVTRREDSISFASKELSYPLTVDISFVVNADGSSAQTTTIGQAFDRQEARLGSGFPLFDIVANAVASTDTLLFDAAGAFTGVSNRNSSQTYSSFSSDRGCYSRSLASANGVLTSVVDGKGCGGDHGHDR
ncbi:MAG: peptide-N(4)-(N-acetyl-beta-glucosaminyl)asparagine amidase, partial [Acidobacteriota bacterium]|nr:peptide-N(4)-(N-acetyl-beta-glucosaminyl)asparagine amidase [Acidobacteriota bacterium]